jgi:putative chitinase
MSIADAPDFVKNPEELLKTKWIGLGLIWYFKTRVPIRFMDNGDIENVTLRINGGLNGLVDRQDKYTICGLVLLGYKPSDVKKFQMDNDLTPDGVSGTLTRMKIHQKLSSMNGAAEPIGEPDGVSSPSPSGNLLSSLIKALMKLLTKGK